MDKPRSLHQRILTDVEARIVSGEWPPGHRIPFETDMARDYGCSRMTVNKALTQLTRAGLLVRNRKSGTFVRAPQSLSAALEITDIRAEVEATGKAYAFQLLRDETGGTPPEHLSAFDFGQIRTLTGLHLADQTPFCYEQRIINTDAVPAASNADFTKECPGAWLLKTVPWNKAEHQISAATADASLADRLQIAPGAAILQIERITQNDTGHVTWARLSYPGARHRLVASFTPSG
ncbi:MAG TPA: UTRA domain-containing protein [Aliiroseovarius sp.]|nr:UTRA domain-containing protein [Aliiroseovarius sp.]